MFAMNFETGGAGGAAFRSIFTGEPNDQSLGMETARIMRKIAVEIEQCGKRNGSCMDVNGNKVGEWKLEDD